MKTKNIIILSLILFSLCLTSCSKKQSAWEVWSPDKKIRITLTLKDSKPEYKVEWMRNDTGITVIEPSPLGITRKDAAFTSNLSFAQQSEIKNIDDNYKMLVGKQSEIHYQANEQTITFRNADNARIQIIIRACNDGVAFRYCFPEESKNIYTVTGESTGFKVPVNGKAWMAPYDIVQVWSPGYETNYKDGIAIGTTSPNKQGWEFPALFHTNNFWILITEANLDSTFYGAHLEAIADSGLYKIRLPEDEETYGYAIKEPSNTLPWSTPWRTIIIGETPANMIESNMVYNLSEPCKLNDISWIKPGRASWSWWLDHSSSGDYKKIVPFIDLAADMGWEYSLVDAGWDVMKNGTIEKLNDYAKTKKVGLILWYNSGGPHTKVDATPRDRMFDPSVREKEMEKIEKMGIKGIKVDFFQSDKPKIIGLYLDILRDAARHHLFVDFHGCTLPRGWSRTFPNLLSMEAVRGAEQYWDTSFAENAHNYHTIYMYTRNAVGPMDYTPVGFSTSQVPHKTTNAHEIALSIVFESGLLHFIDNSKAYKALPDYAQSLIKSVPVSWDETKYIAGEPGKLIVIARRKGNDWYLAGINGEKIEKEISFGLPFIKEGDFSVSFICDGKDDKSLIHEQTGFKPGDTLKIKLLGRGGFSGILKKKKE